MLAEKGSRQDDEVELLTAGTKFRILATMNPGGDFGKKEVSNLLFCEFVYNSFSQTVNVHSFICCHMHVTCLSFCLILATLCIVIFQSCLLHHQALNVCCHSVQETTKIYTLCFFFSKY